MRITNEKLLADVNAILDASGYYMNEVTGEIRQAQAYSYLMSELRDYKYRWRNISDIREGDFEDSGFETLHQGNYYNGPKSPWVNVYPDYKTGKITKGRRVAKSTWLICSKKVVLIPVLEEAWMAEANARNERMTRYSKIYNTVAESLVDSDLTPAQIANEASKQAHAALAAAHV